MTTYYAIDNGNSEQLTTGLPEERVWKVAQRLADERGESVYVYDATPGANGEYTEVEPSAEAD